MDAILTAWQTRTPRERIAVALGVVALTLLLLYEFVWEPVRMERGQLRQSLTQLRAQAAQFAEDAAEAERLRAAAKNSPRSESATAAVQSAADRTGVRASIKTVTEVSGGRVQITLEPIPYEGLVRWVGELARSTGFAVESLQVRRGSTPGVVMVETMVLKGAAL